LPTLTGNAAMAKSSDQPEQMKVGSKGERHIRVVEQ